MTRDTQRARLYKADDVLAQWSKPLPKVADMERFVKKVWSSKRLKASYPKAMKIRPPAVKDGRGHSRNATGGYWEIDMPRWSRTTAVVLHELAHVITQREFPAAAAHGWEYSGVYLRLALLFMGREAHDAFKKSMKEHRVRFTAPRERKPLTPEVRAVLVERLAAARRQREVKIAA